MVDNTTSTNRNELPDGWEKRELVAGMETVGSFTDDYAGMGGGYKCERCNHYIPIKAIDDDTCPACGRNGLIGTIIKGRQEITAAYPSGWFDE